MSDDEYLDECCFADAEDEDEPVPDSELQEEYRRQIADNMVEWQQQREDRLMSRASHSTAPGPGRGRAASRRAAGPAEGERRQRRRYTSNPAEAAGSSFGTVDEGGLDAAPAPQGPDVHDDIVLAFIAQIAAEAAAGQEPGSGSEEEEASEWSQRSARAEAAWREQAPVLGAAVLQVAAAPDPQQLCSVCNTEQGCTVRYVSSRIGVHSAPWDSNCQAQPALSSVGHVLSMQSLSLHCFCLQVLVLFTSSRLCSAVRCLRSGAASAPAPAQAAAVCGQLLEGDAKG